MTRNNQWFFLLAVLCCSIQTKAQDFYNQGIGYNIIDRADRAVEVVGMRGGEYADCYNLINLSIPNSVDYIGRDAFRGCHQLRGHGANVRY